MNMDPFLWAPFFGPFPLGPMGTRDLEYQADPLVFSSENKTRKRHYQGYDVLATLSWDMRKNNQTIKPDMAHGHGPWPMANGPCLA